MNLKKDERGASLVEYAILVALISVIAIAAIRAFGEQMGVTFSQVTSAVESANQ